VHFLAITQCDYGGQKEKKQKQNRSNDLWEPFVKLFRFKVFSGDHIVNSYMITI
jgi:hypothetical protein